MPTSSIAFDLGEGARISSAWDYNSAHTFGGWYFQTGGADCFFVPSASLTAYDWPTFTGGAFWGYVDGGSGGYADVSGGSGSTSTWYYIVGRRRSATAFDLWVGTETVAASQIGTVTTNITGRSAATVVDIGQWSQFSPSNTSGRAAYCWAYTTNLSDAEIEAQRLATTAQRASNLWAFWPLQGASDMADTSGNARTLTAIGTLGTAAGPDIGATKAPPPHRGPRTPYAILAR